MSQLAHTMLHVIEPLTFVQIAPLQPECTKTVSLILDPSALIFVTIRILHGAVTMLQTELPLTCVCSTVSVGSHTEAMRLVVFPLALVSVPVGVVYAPHTREHIVFPVAFVDGAVG